MAINFAAANMAGYNNPTIKIISVTIEADAVINSPSYTKLSNICKSGEYPIIHVTDNNRERCYILPISSYTNDNITFCATYCSDGTSLYSVGLIFYRDNVAPLFKRVKITTSNPK